MKCQKCIEGKILPAIPIPNTKVEDYPDCDYCDGTGVHKERDGKLFYEGKRLNDLRTASRTNMRKFCMDNGFDPTEISKIERGLRAASKNITNAYEAL